MINTNFFVAAGLFAVSNAHMLLSEPKPFAPANAQHAKDPLSAGQFPCQHSMGQAFTTTSTNDYALGSKQTLKWIGTAVHGGGSCQISISYDTNPTPDSVWKVIHSIEGGCPARGQAGNLPDVGDVPAPDTYDYKIPENIPAGKATISVSWLNRIGNREFYMYCGAVELTGAGGDKANYDALPDIYVANVPGVNTCKTPEMTTDWIFPNPGLSLENNIEKYAWKGHKLDGGCGKHSGAAGSGSGSGSGSGPGSSYPSASAPASKPSASAPAYKPSASVPIPGGAFLTKQPDAAPAPTQAPSAVPVAPAPSSPAAPAPGSGSGSGSGSSGALSGKCTDGQWNCVGGSSFQQCGSGVWSPVMQMAPGTKCTAGQSSELKMAAAKRVVRIFRA
ncbi:Eukaryotic translation initiation factor 4 gamma [Apiospora arundinis]